MSQSTLKESLHGIPVSGVMLRDIPRVPWSKKLDCVVEEDVLPSGGRIFLVTDNNNESLRGMLTLRNVTAAPRERWPDLTVQDVMVPRSNFIIVQPEMEMLDALRVMDDANVAQVPVLSDGNVVGILTREGVMHYIRMRTEIGV
jgi:CBS domain-containing protein